ncbi:MAG: HvfC family RiPP maturation protein [Gammaproteobacteria bacterium]
MGVDFKAKQREFTDYLRDPGRYPAPADVDARRMAMYRELFFGNIESFLSGNFPVLRKILDDSTWLALVHDFYAGHACKTPYFSEIAEEFLAYLQDERKNPGDVPFLLELAHYEWAEMALANAQDTLVVNEPETGDVSGRTVCLSSLAWPLIYQFPVHRISPSFMPLSPQEQPTCLIVYRDRKDDVHFVEITPVIYSLLELLEASGGMCVEDALEQMVRIMRPLEPESIRQSGLKALKDLAEKNIITVLA